MKRTDSQFRLRLPESEKAFIRARAERNLRSITAEIVATIRDRMEREALPDAKKATRTAA